MLSRLLLLIEQRDDAAAAAMLFDAAARVYADAMIRRRDFRYAAARHRD